MQDAGPGRLCVVAVASSRPDRPDKLVMKTPLLRIGRSPPQIGHLLTTARFKNLLVSVDSSASGRRRTAQLIAGACLLHG
jgi:hypothetical protein